MDTGNLKASDFVNANERFSLRQKLTPKVDEAVSKVVGKNILARDPRLIALIAKWKMQKRKPDSDLRPDNFLNDPEKVKELRKTFI